MNLNYGTQLHCGDKVRRLGTDCVFEGYVIGVFSKHNDDAQVRYAVENDDRVVHVYAGKALEKMEAK